MPLAPQRSLPFPAPRGRKSLVTGEEWRTGSSLAAATSAATSAASMERLPEQAKEQIEYIPVPQASASQVIGSLPRLDVSAAPVYHQVRQEQIAAGETTRNIVENSTVQEQVIVPEIPELQVMERIQAQIVESIKEVPQERVQQRTVEQIMHAPAPQTQEQVIVQEIPEVQVVVRIQAHIVETIKENPRERYQQRTVEKLCARQ